jgi:hypothetical protein
LRGAAKRSRKLTPFQARFLLDCLTVEFEDRRASGHKSLSRGFYAGMAAYFGVAPETVKDIWKRRTFKWLPIRNIYTISLKHRAPLLDD